MMALQMIALAIKKLLDIWDDLCHNLILRFHLRNNNRRVGQMQDRDDNTWQGENITSMGATIICALCKKPIPQCQCIKQSVEPLDLKPTISDSLKRINKFTADQVKTCEANKPKNKTKRRKRFAAMAELLDNKAQRLGIQGRRLSDRTKITQDSIWELQMKSGLQSMNQSIYCQKTGAVVGTITMETLATLEMLNAPSDEIALLQNNGLHPAWLNTSPDRLRELQRIMPHHYVIYCYCRLTEKLQSVSGKGKNTLLEMLKQQDLKAVVECAELLRTALGLIGRHKPACSKLPEFNVTDLTLLNVDIRHWLAKAILSVQKSHHAKDIDRQHTMTLADVARFKMDIGYSQFGQARIGSIEDDALLLDLTEIFGNDDVIKTARTYNAPKIIKAKAFKFETKLNNVETGMLKITFAKPEKE